jgi:hypothetical protein
MSSSTSSFSLLRPTPVFIWTVVAIVCIELSEALFLRQPASLFSWDDRTRTRLTYHEATKRNGGQVLFLGSSHFGCCVRPAAMEPLLRRADSQVPTAFLDWVQAAYPHDLLQEAEHLVSTSPLPDIVVLEVNARYLAGTRLDPFYYENWPARWDLATARRVLSSDLPLSERVGLAKRMAFARLSGWLSPVYKQRQELKSLAKFAVLDLLRNRSLRNFRERAIAYSIGKSLSVGGDLPRKKRKASLAKKQSQIVSPGSAEETAPLVDLACRSLTDAAKVLASSGIRVVVLKPPVSAELRGLLSRESGLDAALESLAASLQDIPDVEFWDLSAQSFSPPLDLEVDFRDAHHVCEPVADRFSVLVASRLVPLLARATPPRPSSGMAPSPGNGTGQKQ